VIISGYDRFLSMPRVGRWGREFAFPKFRSMVVDAEKIKDQLIDQSDLGDSITFKIKKILVLHGSVVSYANSV